MKYLVEQSDKRNAYLTAMLKASEFSFADANADAAIVFSPARKLNAAEAEKLPQGATVIGGGQSAEIAVTLRQRKINYINLMDGESYAVKNAKLTAEGALYLVIGNTDKSIFENNVLILGCGRVGKAAALLFKKLGVKTSIATFDKAEFDAASLYADRAFFGVGELSEFDVIINTIPKRFLDAAAVRPETVVIELASVDCLDREKPYPFKYIPAGGLPAKYCAESAARLIYDQLKNEN